MLHAKMAAHLSLLGWCECCTVDTEQQAWRLQSFDDSHWVAFRHAVPRRRPPLVGRRGGRDERRRQVDSLWAWDFCRALRLRKR